MIDIHNFARWNGGIIGQGGPTDAQFVSLWTQLATKYAFNPKVVFELMNEPDDLDITVWAQTCQKGRNSHPHRRRHHTGNPPPAAPTSTARRPSSRAGSPTPHWPSSTRTARRTGLLLDIHEYLDADNSGTHAECVTDNVAAFATVTAYLRDKGRQGLVSETGASPGAASCMTAFCAQNAFMNANSDVFVGLVGWAAGSFGPEYLLSLTPRRKQGGGGSGLVDNALAARCLVGTWVDAGESGGAVPVSSSVGVGLGRRARVLLMDRPVTRLQRSGPERRLVWLPLLMAGCRPLLETCCFLLPFLQAIPESRS
jgi:endoglucanase